MIFTLRSLPLLERPSGTDTIWALWDSVTGGDINQTSPPYRVRITGTSQLPRDLKALIDSFVALMSDARVHGSPVEVVCEQ
jgi:hypothetical protein